MSLFSKRYTQTADQLIPSRTLGAMRGTVAVNNETALRHSAVWACLRLRANLVSMMPVDLFRRVRLAGEVGEHQVEMPKPAILVNPGGERVSMGEWMYSTQFDLDRGGNVAGLIADTDRYGLPTRIDLVALGDWTVIVRDGEIRKFRIGGTLYDPEKVWHEKQYTVAGMHIGLSPVAYAAWSIGEYLSIQDFALEWFGNATVPPVHLKNTAKVLTETQALDHKARFMASVQTGQPWVSGEDWEINPLTVANQANQWIEGKQYGVGDIARFFDVPGDLIDADASTGRITYANITARNLQMLIMHLQATVKRREDALTTVTPRPQFVKLNTNALLRMDPQMQAEVFNTQINGRYLAPSEAREKLDLPPLTDAQKAEFTELFGAPGAKAPIPLGPKQPTGVTP
jgi:HK97 family phage portal protein